MSEANDKVPFLLIQKPQELIKLFEGLIDRKIREIGTLTLTPPVSAAGESPFLSVYFDLCRCEKNSSGGLPGQPGLPPTKSIPSTGLWWQGSQQ